jgi:hypothetical protein
MSELFVSAPKDYREARLRDYRDYLIERDGELNLRDRTLSRREVATCALETPPPCPRHLDEAEFRRHYQAFDKRNPPSEEMMLLLALVKTNAAEAYGVNRNFDKLVAKAKQAEADLELRILIEESYHTRILLSSANRYGIAVEEPYTPPSALRVLIAGIAGAPPAMSRALVMGGEILGTLAFLKLLEVTGRVLKHDPETRDALEERLIQICIDERGHISFNRLLAGPATLAQVRLILPIMAKAMSTIVPEANLIGGFPNDLWREMARLNDPRRLPEPIRKQAFLA